MSNLMGSPLRVLALEHLVELGPGGWLDEHELARSVTALEEDVRACLEPLHRKGWLERRSTERGVSWRITVGRRPAIADTLRTEEAPGGSLVDRLRRVQRGAMGSIVGFDPRMKMVFEKARIASRANVPVLLEGESGTGKAIVAQAIQQLGSGDAEAPFLSVSALRLPPGGIPALLAAAAGGTVYLANPAALTPADQEVLLEALHTQRTGRAAARPWRLITGSEVPLMVEVEAGRFSKELSRRLDVFRIRMPALRERMDDIPMLAEQFRARASLRGIPATSGFSQAGLELLSTQAWPGNLRQLEGTVQAACILAGGGIVDAAHVTQALRPLEPGGVVRQAPAGPIVPLGDVIKGALLD
ncbi:MAG: two-component system response regulator HydG, partial [Myxococcota bacterium]